MGPARYAELAMFLPSRPKFSWNIRNVPWIDGAGNHSQYAIEVRR